MLTLTLGLSLLTSMLLAEEVVKQDTTEVKKEEVNKYLPKEQEIMNNKPLQDKWTINPFNCYLDISAIVFSRCMDDLKGNMSDCQDITIDNVKKVCGLSTGKYIFRTVKETVKDEKIPENIKNFSDLPPKSKQMYQAQMNKMLQQMYYFSGMKAGYYFAKKDYVKIKEKEEEIKSKLEMDKELKVEELVPTKKVEVVPLPSIEK